MERIWLLMFPTDGGKSDKIIIRGKSIKHHSCLPNVL
jgi:hypothetical protein